MNKLDSFILKEIKKRSDFVDDFRTLLLTTTDEQERINRLQVLDNLLLLATYADIEQLENEFKVSLPLDSEDNTLTYLCQILREINGICTNSLSDDHEVYINLFQTLKSPTEDQMLAAREQFRSQLISMIFEKTI